MSHDIAAVWGLSHHAEFPGDDLCSRQHSGRLCRGEITRILKEATTLEVTGEG